MAEKNISNNKYGELKPFISNNNEECNWIPLTDNISVEYNPNLVIRISNILWEFNEKQYNDEVEFTVDLMKYNNDNNRYFESKINVIPFKIPLNRANLNIVKYNDKKEYEKNSSFTMDFPEEFFGEVDAFEFLYSLHNMINQKEELKNILGEKAIFSGLIENCPGNFDLVIDASKKSPLDRIKDNFKKALGKHEMYQVDYEDNIEYIIGDIREFVEINPNADVLPLTEHFAVMNYSNTNWKLLNYEWIFDPEIDIKGPIEMIDAIEYFNKEFNPSVGYIDSELEDLSVPTDILVLQTTKWIDEPPYIGEDYIYLHIPNFKELDYTLNSIDLIYVLQNLICHPSEEPIDFNDHNYLFGIIEVEPGYYHLLLDSPYQEISVEDREKMIEHFKKEGVINE